MPQTITIEPAEISVFDLSGGWMPDLAPEAVPKNGLLDVNNLIPDRETGTLETRAGFQRFSDLLSANPELSDFEVRTIATYSRDNEALDSETQRWLMVMVHKLPKPSPREADDVRVYAINLDDGTSQRIDDAGRIWKHWAAGMRSVVVNNIFYGHTERDPLFSWRPYFKDGTTNPDPYEPDASMGQWTANDWATDTAYTVGDRVVDEVEIEKLSGGTKFVKFVFVCTKDHTSKQFTRPGKVRVWQDLRWENIGRYIPEWEDATDYQIGDEVSYFVNDANQAQKFPRYHSAVNKKSTFVCIRNHTSNAGTNEPPGQPWVPLRAPKGGHMHFHGGRVFVRDSDAGTARIRYSDLADESGFWDPTNWDSGDIQEGGYIDIPSNESVGPMHTLNKNLIIACTDSIWSLSGYNPSTWSLSQISTRGATSMVEHEGLLYMFDDEGMFVTDGVSVQEAPNGHLIRDWFHDNIDLDDSARMFMDLHSYMGFIWISLPVGGNVSRANMTVLYDPTTASFWKLDMASNNYETAQMDRVDELFFSKVGTPALVMRYARKDAGGVPDVNMNRDDTGVVTQAFEEIPWLARLCWFTFGPWKEQRRIRRTWVRIKTAIGSLITLKAFRDYEVASFDTTARTTTVGPVTHVEGSAVRDRDPHAYSLQVEGDRAPASLISTHIQTQFRRRRYNRGARA